MHLVLVLVFVNCGCAHRRTSEAQPFGLRQVKDASFRGLLFCDLHTKSHQVNRSDNTGISGRSDLRFHLHSTLSRIVSRYL